MSRPDAGAWDLSPETTLPRLLAANARACPDRVAVREKDRGIWQQLRWPEWLDTVLACAAGLEAIGFAAGDALVVVGDNRANLYAGILGAGALAGLPMPLFPDAPADEVAQMIAAAGARFALAEDQEQVDKLLELRERCPALATIVYDDPRGLARYAVPGLVSWRELLERGRARLASEAGLREALIARATPDDPAVLIHSSGTTGVPKRLVLTHRNVLAGAANMHRAGAFERHDDVLAYLPMAWIGDFGISNAAAVAFAFTINIPERSETAIRDLREIAPTVYLAAPRSWDNLLTMVQVRMEDSTRLKKAIYDFFMKVAVESERAALAGRRPTPVQRLLRAAGEWLVYAPIKDQFGLTRMRCALTGGEAIGEDTFVFYRALGVRLRQLYGQTENSAFNALQAEGEVRLHTVGRPLPGVEIRIDASGEILLRAASVFSGYRDNPEATAAALDADGFLHSGDAGYFEPDGHLVVLGRLSEVVHTAAGERYIPNYIENRLKFSPWIKDVAVVGSGRPWLAAMVCIDREPVGHWAERRGISTTSYADLAQRPEVIALVREAIARVNATLPEPLRLRRFVCLHKEFDADDGEITRTRKLRRNVVEERYAAVLDALYGAQPTVALQARVAYESGEVGVTERVLALEGV
nr:AMP-binding protein [Caldimonas sp.]